MTLFELGTQYLSEEAKLKKRLAELMALLKECTVEQEANSLRSRIYYLKREIYDCHEWGEYLITYYDIEEREAI